MSLLRSEEAPCSTCAAHESDGTFDLKLVPVSLDVSDDMDHAERMEQYSLAHDAQRHHLSDTENLASYECDGNSSRAEVAFGATNDVGGISELIDDTGLALQVKFSPNNESSTLCAQVTADHINELMRDGLTTVPSPMGQGSFRLHSTQEGLITGIELVR